MPAPPEPAATDAQVQRVVIQPGALVTPDSVILELVSPEVTQAALEAESQLRAAEADYQNLEAQLASQALTQESQAAAVVADAEEARLRAEADTELAKAGLVSSLTQRLSTLRADQLKKRAAERMQIPAEEVAYAAGVFSARNSSGVAITLAQLMHATLTDGAIVGRGVSTKLPFGVEIGAHVADVEVDPETGQVTVLRYTAFQDVGLALNPAAIEGQIQGSVVQGLGWALTEGFDYDEQGRLRNASLLDYRLPTALDVPSIECVILETPVPGVPYGVRGVGEVPIVPPAAAIANAIARAVGVRLQQMPMTPERIVRALQGRG